MIINLDDHGDYNECTMNSNLVFSLTNQSCVTSLQLNIRKTTKKKNHKLLGPKPKKKNWIFYLLRLVLNKKKYTKFQSILTVKQKKKKKTTAYYGRSSLITATLLPVHFWQQPHDLLRSNHACMHASKLYYGGLPARSTRNQ